MRRMRLTAAVIGTLALAGAMTLGGTTAAQAAPTGHWGQFSVSGTARAYTGTVTMPGFPDTTFTSTSRQSQVISGASTWQGTATPPGSVYGSSRDNTYLNQRPSADNANSPSVTTYTFADVTPANPDGGTPNWSFVLGDIDADQATVTATDVNGNAVSGDQLGFGSSYNSCSSVSPGGWSCGRATTDDPTPGSDTPTWTGGATSGVLVGNATASDTAGATAWFSPTVPLKTLTITYQQRSGFPVYQTWFANRTAGLTGTATLDGGPYPGATVVVTAPRGVTYTTTTAADGTYAFPELPMINGYTVQIVRPGTATGDDTGTANLAAADATVDFAFSSPPDTTSIVGQVVDGEQQPVADVPVVVDPGNGDAPIETVTNAGGNYVVPGLPPETDVTVAVDGGTPETVTTGAAGSQTVAPPIAAPEDAIAVVSGSVTVNGTGTPGVTVTLTNADGDIVATTTTDADGAYAFPARPRSDSPLTVTVDAPAGASGTTTAQVSTTAGDATADFTLTEPEPIEAAQVTAPSRTPTAPRSRARR